MSEQNARDWLLSQNRFNNNRFSVSKQGIAKTIAFASGKGGVGKTSLALKMSKMLSDSGNKVLLIDCDHNLSNSILKLGFPVNNNFYSLITAQKSFDECIYRVGDLHILSGCNGNIELFDKGLELDKFIVDIIVAHEQSYDYIILDFPAGMAKDMVALTAYCNYRFFIVTPDKSSLTDSYSLIKILHSKYGIRANHLLVNKVSSERQYKRVIKSICETVEHFLSGRVHILGSVRYNTDTVDKFDSILFKNADSVIHKDISKIVKTFSEGDTMRSFSEGYLEKDVGV